MTEIDTRFLVEEITNSVRGGRTPQQAFKRLAVMIGEQNLGLLEQALEEYLKKTRGVRSSETPTGLVDSQGGGWYLGSSDGDIFWPAFKRVLREERGWDAEAVNSVDIASTKILSLLQSPGQREIHSRGLVMGHVQSGKTTNYTAVIAKGADAGYKFFLVLSGMTNPLRTQTQTRLENELVDPNREHWFPLTSKTDDFRPGSIGNAGAFLTDNQALKVLGVVKKNAVVLRRLINWLRTASDEVLRSCPILIVDDEADLASINTSEYEDTRSTINSLLLEILTSLPKCAYLGYTATPFANMFVDPAVPEGLYPKDFIIDLPKPEGYFGPESIFGRAELPSDDEGEVFAGLDMVRLVPDQDVDSLKPRRRDDRHSFYPELTPSLRAAVEYFWLAVAARKARGQEALHSTMLIHTSLYVVVQERFKPLLESLRLGMLRDLRGEDSQISLARLRNEWGDEQDRLPARTVGRDPISFDDLRGHLEDAVAETKVVVENSRTEQRLEFGERSKTQIVVGGNTLSRGLTLEGLIVSFFVRSSTAYDTLLQMGRWFGFRDGYEDLPRIWMTGELERYFYDLATVEREIREDIRRYQLEGITPLDFGVRIRTHPDLAITSRLKMQNSVAASVSYSGQRLQTLLFKHKDADWLEANLQAASRVIEAVHSSGHNPKKLGENLVFEDVPAGPIVEFLGSYLFHERSANLDSRLLCGYIRAQNREGELQRWNLVVRGKAVTENEEPLPLSGGFQVPLLNRSRRALGGGDEETAHLGALMSGGDTVIDLDLAPSEIEGSDEAELRQMRPPGLGLLILYPISKDSQPRVSSAVSAHTALRAPLNAVRHVMGLALVFPEAQDLTPQEYRTVDLSGVERERLDISIDDEDPEDQE